ncbi:MAG TPA: cold-shock protein [Chlamydiales bacterium]|nr:cold-shock protein [Chlamydiales bacterium]
MEKRLHGTVKWFNKGEGFGFIAPDDGGRDVYVQISGIETPDQSLMDGQRVIFEIAVGRKGPEAVHVQLA